MEAMGIIFSNIYDNNMGELTRERTSASIPFGSRYRQIDFALSNMANSKISNIGIVTKYNYQSLMDHLGNCEEWDLKLGEGVRFLPPYATGHTGAYRGKLEAMQTAMPVLGRSDAEYVVLSDTDSRIEVWSRERWQAYTDEVEPDVTAIAATLTDLGI